MRHAVALCLAALAGALAASAQPITIGETVKLQSTILGEERTVLVSPPPRYAQSQDRYPVLYMTDGDANLLHTRGTVDFLVRNGLMPDVIIVGVTNTNRTRDLSPTRWMRPRLDNPQQMAPVGGGADYFLEFFAKELFPYVEGHYRTAPYRLFAGHSLGGLLALYVFTDRPNLFNAVIAASPALNWDNDFIIRKTEEFFKDRKELPRTLFVTMADEEEGEPAPTRFGKLLAIIGGSKASGFIWASKSMPEETHGTVVLRSHYWGLRKIFEGWQLPVDRQVGFKGGLAELKQHYAGLSKRFSFEVVPPEPLVNQVGYQLLGRNDVDGAIAVFRYNVELRPGSANVYDSLGDALARAGKTEESLASYEKAVARAKETGDPLLNALTANRDRAVAAAQPKKSSP
jgi:hypothetical protein